MTNGPEFIKDNPDFSYSFFSPDFPYESEGGLSVPATGPFKKINKTLDKTKVILAGVTAEAKKAGDSYRNLFLVMDSPDPHLVLQAGSVIPDPVMRRRLPLPLLAPE